jgi:amino acid adenylation domain-containing protein
LNPVKAEYHSPISEPDPAKAVVPADAEGVSVHELFEAQAARTPDATALVFENSSITYHELNERANQLAHHLQALGVGPESFCGICVERSIGMLVGVLGILKTGAAYVPMDAAYPHERLAFMLEDTRMPVLLTEQHISEALKSLDTPDTKIVLLDSDWQRIAEHRADNLNVKAAAGRPAYVIYTSGSTGKPKGVLMCHAALVNLLGWQSKSSQAAGGGKRTVQFASLSFDVSFQEMFSTWCDGGTLLLVSDELRRDVRRLWELLLTGQVERLFVPPVVLQRLAEVACKQERQPDTLREVITAGEQLKITPQVRAMFARLPNCTLDNQYGPSESHVVTAYRLAGDPNAWTELPPIGHPIANTEIYILDEHLQPAETGIAGELYIGGACLAHGYLNRTQLTAERFITNPFRADGTNDESGPQGRLYRTGDLARRLSDGNIEFLGRIDHQVKIRGYRVETGEVETALLSHPEIREAVVTARADANGSRRLVAYLVCNDPQVQRPHSVSELRDFLSRKLPEFMIPSMFLHLDALPLTPNGKVDRAVLPAPNDERPDMQQSIAPPTNETQARLQEIWERVLDVHPVGVKDNFFELGGDSLQAVAILMEINEVFGKNLPASSLLTEGTIESLARTIAETGHEEEWSALVPIQTEGKRPPLFFVHPIGGEVYSYAALSRHLGADQPFYGIQARGLDGKQSPFRDIVAMATHYTEEILRVHPAEPFLLGGYSLGGTIAFEMAQQLYRKGHRQIHVLILDEEAPGPSPRGFTSVFNVARNFPYWFVHHVARRPENELRESVRRNLKKLARRVRRTFGGGANGSSPADYEAGLADILDITQLPEIHRKINTALYEAWINYQPDAYPGSLILFRSRAQPLLSRLGMDKGWNRLAAEGVEVKIVPGNHNDMYEEPHALPLAREIKSYLQQRIGGVLLCVAHSSIFLM